MKAKDYPSLLIMESHNSHKFYLKLTNSTVAQFCLKVWLFSAEYAALSEIPLFQLAIKRKQQTQLHKRSCLQCAILRYVCFVFLLTVLQHTCKIIVCKSGCRLSLPFLFCLDVCFKTSSVFIPNFDVLVLNAKCVCPCKLDFFQRRLNWKNHLKCA